MCDDRTATDNAEYVRATTMTRRQFGAVSAGAGLAMLLPRAANAQDVSAADIDVTTPMAWRTATSCTPRLAPIPAS